MKPLTLLIVDDDDRDFAASLGFLLQIAGGHVDLAFNCEEALQRRLGIGEFDLILLDVQRPGMNGVDCLRRPPALDCFATPLDAATLLRFIEDRMTLTDKGLPR
jgi:CheY-like chemotaxis protein